MYFKGQKNSFPMYVLELSNTEIGISIISDNINIFRLTNIKKWPKTEANIN